MLAVEILVFYSRQKMMDYSDFIAKTSISVFFPNYLDDLFANIQRPAIVFLKKIRLVVAFSFEKYFDK